MRVGSAVPSRSEMKRCGALMSAASRSCRRLAAPRPTMPIVLALKRLLASVRSVNHSTLSWIKCAPSPTICERPRLVASAPQAPVCRTGLSVQLPLPIGCWRMRCTTRPEPTRISALPPAPARCVPVQDPRSMIRRRQPRKRARSERKGACPAGAIAQEGRASTMDPRRAPVLRIPGDRINRISAHKMRAQLPRIRQTSHGVPIDWMEARSLLCAART
ncbi:hypothetical protein ACVWY5_001238 [Bradyrhizobium sp. USDA 3256]